MDPIIFTPRLKLTLITKAERGSPELEWLHELRSNEQTTWWSIFGQAKTIEDTEKVIKGHLPTKDGEEKTYRVCYAVHKVLEPTSASAESESPASQAAKPTEFIGLVTLVSVDGHSLPLPEHLTLPAAAASTTLSVEVAYMFLPTGWGQGYATESVAAVFDACKTDQGQSFWAPFTKLYVRSIVNEENPPSLRVMEKTGMVDRGVYEWTGKPIWLAGQWVVRSRLHIYGMFLLE